MGKSPTKQYFLCLQNCAINWAKFGYKMSIIDSPCFTFPHAFCLCVVLIWVLSVHIYRQQLIGCSQFWLVARSKSCLVTVFHISSFSPLVTLYMLLILLILAYWLFLTDACYINQSTVLVQGKAARSYARSFNLPCLPELRREGGEGGREGGGTEKGGGEEREREGGREREEGEFIASNSRRIGDRNSYFSLFGEKCPKAT